MSVWPDKDELLLKQFVEQLRLRTHGAPYRSLLRRFQRFVSRHSPEHVLTRGTLRAWLREGLRQSPPHLVVHYAQLAN